MVEFLCTYNDFIGNLWIARPIKMYDDVFYRFLSSLYFPFYVSFVPFGSKGKKVMHLDLDKKYKLDSDITIVAHYAFNSDEV